MVRANFPKGMSAAMKLATMYPGGKEDECWVWPYAKITGGYGQIHDDPSGSKMRTHVVSYSSYVKIPEPHHFVLHKCDNRPCWNPAHLFEGTQLDNIKDMISKDRMRSQFHGNQPKGEAHGRAKLTNQDIVTIRKLAADGMKLAHIAKLYSVSAATISYIVNNLRWSHIR